MNNKLVPSILAITLIASFAAAAPKPQNMNSDMPMQSGSMQEMKMAGTTSIFKGPEVNGGTASLYRKGNEWHLKVSEDFKIPAAPAPHWQVVDAKGNVFLLSRFTLIGDKTRRDIKLPSYITSVAKVQVYCSFAEVILGEASFSKTMMLGK